MARTRTQRPAKQPHQKACYLCATTFSSETRHKHDLGSRRDKMNMIPKEFRRDLIDGEWFTREEHRDAFIHVCCLCKGAVNKFFTDEERLRHLTSPPMLQWALKMIGFTEIRTDRHPQTAKMVHGMELLDTFNAENEACKKFKREWLTIHPQYPARRALPRWGEEEEFVEPSYEPHGDLDDVNDGEDEAEDEQEDEDEDMEDEEGYQLGYDQIDGAVDDLYGDDDLGLEMDDDEGYDHELREAKAESENEEDTTSNNSDGIAAALIRNAHNNAPAPVQHPPQVSPYIRRDDLFDLLQEAREEVIDHRREADLAQANQLQATILTLNTHLHAQEQKIVVLEKQVEKSLRAQQKSDLKRRALSERLSIFKDDFAIQVKRVDRKLEGGLDTIKECDGRVEGIEDETRTLLDRMEELEDRFQDLTDIQVSFKRKRENDTPFEADERPSSSALPTARHGQQTHKSKSYRHEREEEEEVEEGSDNELELEAEAPPPTKKHKHNNGPASTQANGRNSNASSSSSSSAATKVNAPEQDYIRRKRPQDLEMYPVSRLAETIKRHKEEYAVNRNLIRDTEEQS